MKITKPLDIKIERDQVIASLVAATAIIATIGIIAARTIQKSRK